LTKYNIINNSNSPIEFENEVHSLCGFAQERLGFKKLPTLVFDGDDQNSSKILAKTGHYDSSTMEIHVFTTGRHPKDILRSIAHELVHHSQHDKGVLDHSGYTGAGYAQKNPHLRDMEKEANSPMLFRDWEDSLKEKHPTIYNERRNRKMSLKDWKNKELGQNLTEKWGFKMDLSKLNEGEIPDQLKPFVNKKEEDSDNEDKKEDKKEDESEAKDSSKPDFPDVDGDGDRNEPITKAQQDKKEKVDEATSAGGIQRRAGKRRRK
tara:strand:+ start:774 stop:1565 length:792 start_codon:yes stop_codon:yes gene_type:complete